MPQSMKIDFVSDVSCPWCVIGLKALEAALQNCADDVSAEIHFQPFELNPNMAPGGQDLYEHIGQKYGLDRAQSDNNREMIRQRGEEVGFSFDMHKLERIFNTFDAHRLLHLAAAENCQHALKMALFDAYFVDGEDPGDHAVLKRVAQSVGLAPQRVSALLESDEFAEDVRKAQAFYHSQGIHAVPAIIINDKHLIEGGQPVEVFERALRHLAAEK